MKKLTVKDLRKLKHGDYVLQFKDTIERKLHFVGIIPNNPNYLIFCEGEHLEFLYINPKTEMFKYDWYPGSITIKERGEIIISKINEKIQSLEQDKINVKKYIFEDEN